MEITTIKAKLNKNKDKAYINIDELLQATYGDKLIKTDTGKTFKGYKVYDYDIKLEGGWHAGTKDVRNLKRDAFIYYPINNGEIDLNNGAVAKFPSAKGIAKKLVDEMMHKLSNLDVVIG